MSAVLLGMGNALVDFAAEVMPDQPFYAEIKQNKGGFFHTSEDEFEAMEQELAKGRIIKRSCGGSVANSLKAFAKLGGKAAFVGRIGDDELGAYFAEDLHKFGIRPILNQAMAQRSGCSIVWLDENGEKTICAKRRAAKEFRENWLDWKALAESDWLFVEGYWLDVNASLVVKIIKTAVAAGAKVAFTLSDPKMVVEYKPRIKNILPFVDIVFGNEAEFEALGGCRKIKLAVKTMGENGVETCYKGNIMHYAPLRVERVVSTTGAGDAFAGGFLFRYMQDGNIRGAVSLGQKCAVQVLESQNSHV